MTATTAQAVLPGFLVPGFALHVQSPSDEAPAIVGVTTHEVRSAAELDAIRAQGPALAAQMRDVPGFCGAVLFAAGQRMFTVSGWADEAGPHAISAVPGPHRDAIRAVMHGGLTLGGMHGMWRSHTLRLLTRCPECATVADSLRAAHRCPRCGAALPTENRYL